MIHTYKTGGGARNSNVTHCLTRGGYNSAIAVGFIYKCTTFTIMQFDAGKWMHLLTRFNMQSSMLYARFRGWFGWNFCGSVMVEIVIHYWEYYAEFKPDTLAVMVKVSWLFVAVEGRLFNLSWVYYKYTSTSSFDCCK